MALSGRVEARQILTTRRLSKGVCKYASVICDDGASEARHVLGHGRKNKNAKKKNASWWRRNPGEEEDRRHIAYA